MTPWETLAVVGAVACVAAAVVYRRSLARSIIASAAAPLDATYSDPVGDLYRAFARLEEVGKRQGLARIADQFSSVHASTHQGFIQAALAAPAPPATDAAVPKAQGGASDG